MNCRSRRSIRTSRWPKSSRCGAISLLAGRSRIGGVSSTSSARRRSRRRSSRRHRLPRRRHHGRFDGGQPLGRRAPGHRDRQSHALQRRPHRARRADGGARRRGSAQSDRLRAQDQTIWPRLHLYRAQSGACARGGGPAGHIGSRPRCVADQSEGHDGARADRVPDRLAAQGAEGAQRNGSAVSRVDRPALRGAADHYRLHPLACAVHEPGAGGFPRALYLHDLPLHPAAADPARGGPHVRDRRRRNRPLLSLDHRVFRLRFRRAVQGIRAWLARRRRGPGVGGSGRLRQRPAHRQGRHPILHDDSGDPVLLGRHGDGAVGRQVLCVARRRGELGLAVDRRTPVRLGGERALAAGGVDPGAVDGAHRRLSLAYPHPPPLRRAHALHRRLRTTSRASSASTSTAKRSRSSR